MSEKVTLELSDAVVQTARAVAERTHRRVEEILVEWLDHAITEMPIESLPDDQVLALRDTEMSPQQQTELSKYLAQQREGFLDNTGHACLNELMGLYRCGMVRKARALKVAVERGLQPPIG